MTRTCADCPADISHRHGNAKRCHDCAVAHEAATTRRYRETHRADIRDSHRAWSRRNAKPRACAAVAWRRSKCESDPAYRERFLSACATRFASRRDDMRGRLVARDGVTCAWCGEPMIDPFDTRAVHVDHRTPVSRGGGDEESNLQLLHMPCNIRKRARTMEER